MNIEKMREMVREEYWGDEPYAVMLTAAADEVERLRAEVEQCRAEYRVLTWRVEEAARRLRLRRDTIAGTKVARDAAIRIGELAWCLKDLRESTGLGAEAASPFEVAKEGTP